MEPEGLRALQTKQAGSAKGMVALHVSQKTDPTTPQDTQEVGNRRSSNVFFQVMKLMIGLYVDNYFYVLCKYGDIIVWIYLSLKHFNHRSFPFLERRGACWELIWDQPR